MSNVQKYKEFIKSFSPEDSWLWWESNSNRPELLVYQVNTEIKKMSFRAYDDTPSVAIYSSLRYVDFGGDGESKDPVNRIMEVTGLGFLKAVDLFLSWEDSIDTTERVQWNRTKDKKSEVAPYKTSYLRKMISNRISFKNAYLELRKELFRGCSSSEIKYAENVLHIGYEPANKCWADRIFLPELDHLGVAYGSYRYNRKEGRKKNGRKGLLRKNSKRIIYGEHMLPKYKNVIMYNEGHSDTVINISKRYGTVTTGSSTKKFGKNLKKLKGKVLIDFPDLDLPGMKGAMSRSMEIEEFNLTALPEDKIRHIIFWWAEWLRSESINSKIVNGHVLKTDMFYSIKDKIPSKKGFSFLNLDLLEEIQKDICMKKKWPLEKLSIKKWHIIFKNTSKIEGFDFADFYTEESSPESVKLISFLDSKVKY